MRPLAALPALALAAAPPVAAAVSPVFAPASTGLPASNAGYDCSIFNPGGWTGVDFGDIDGDGDDDLAAVGRLLTGLHAFLSDGAGGWTESSAGLDLDCHGRSDLELADFDGDGDLDLGGIGGINGPPVAFRGDGAGGWSPASTGLAAGNGEGFTFGDFDGDGNLDAALVGHFSGGVHAWLGDGAGNWTEVSQGLPSTTGGHRTTAADFDGDGRDELVATQFGTFDPLIDGVFLWSYDAVAGWSVVWSAYFDQPVGVAAADADQDGWPDLFVAAAQDRVGSLGSVHVFRNAGDGRTFAEDSTGLPVEDALYGDLAVRDLDGDGDPDVFTGDRNGFLRVFLNGGASGWSEATSTGLPTSGDNTEGVAIGDLDGDCRMDLADADYTGGVRAWRETAAFPCAIVAEAGPPRRLAGCGSLTLDGSASKACSCPAAEVRYRWWQDGMLLRDWDVSPAVGVTPSADASFRLDVACAADLACWVSDHTAVAVTAAAVPPALGNVLRMVKAPPTGCAAAWTDLPGTWGDYELLLLPAALGPPTQAAFDGPLAVIGATAAPGLERAVKADGLLDPPGLVFYRIRATGACGGKGPA